jgi:hypothetical protein
MGASGSFTLWFVIIVERAHGMLRMGGWVIPRAGLYLGAKEKFHPLLETELWNT